MTGGAEHPPSPDSVINMKNGKQCVWIDKVPPTKACALSAAGPRLHDAVIRLGPVGLGQRCSGDWISPWPDLSDPEQAEPLPACQPGSMRWLIN